MSALAPPAPPPAAPARRSGSVAGADAPLPASGGASSAAILLVEDDPEIRAIYAGFLRHAGYDVVAAADGPAALAAVHEGDGRLDLLVTDLALPWLDGRALAGLLRQRDPGLRVLFVSGDDAAMAAGRDTAPRTRHLSKPLTRSMLLAHVTALLGAAAPRAARA